MEYIKRELERKFLRMSSFFKAVLVTGARQVGKTTMLRHLCEGQNRTYVTLDNMMARTLAQTDPVLFFRPTNRLSSLTRCSMRRNCLHRSKYSAMKASRLVNFGLPVRSDTE